jgi:hypothetical protein
LPSRSSLPFKLPGTLYRFAQESVHPTIDCQSCHHMSRLIPQTCFQLPSSRTRSGLQWIDRRDGTKTSDILEKSLGEDLGLRVSLYVLSRSDTKRQYTCSFLQCKYTNAELTELLLICSLKINSHLGLSLKCGRPKDQLHNSMLLPGLESNQSRLPISCCSNCMFLFRSCIRLGNRKTEIVKKLSRILSFRSFLLLQITHHFRKCLPNIPS